MTASIPYFSVFFRSKTIRCSFVSPALSDKTDHGQKRIRQNGPRFKTKSTTSQDKTAHVSGQNGPGFRTKRATFQDKTDHILGQKRTTLEVPKALQRHEESSQILIYGLVPRSRYSTKQYSLAFQSSLTETDIYKSRKENPQKLTQLSSRSHPRHLVGKRTAQKDTIIDITSDSQVNSYFPYR